MSRPGWRIRSFVLIAAAGLVAWAVWPGEPALSPAERLLVGNWGCAVTDAGVRWGTQAGMITHPWHVVEFSADRVFREWIVSADRPRHRCLWLEGRWSAADGRLRIENRPLASRLGREIRAHLPNWAWRLRSGTQNVGKHVIPYTLPTRDVLELTSASPYKRLSPPVP
jgi:hypothetical protein